MVLSFVHLVLNHSSAYTVLCLHGCFSKVSKNRVSRGPPVPKQLSPHHLSAFLFFTILNPHRSVSKKEAAPYKFETLQFQLRIVKRGERQYITVSLAHLYVMNEVLKMVPSLLPSSNQYSFPYQLTQRAMSQLEEKDLTTCGLSAPASAAVACRSSRTPDKNQ